MVGQAKIWQSVCLCVLRATSAWVKSLGNVQDEIFVSERPSVLGLNS